MIRYEDRFLLARCPEPWRDALRIRGLPEPVRDRRERAWVWDDEGAAAVAFLHEAYGVPLDDAAAERVPRVDGTARLRAVEAKLRPYQRDGVAFLVDRRRALLADGMGLGKTVQALLALERLEGWPAVVLCPASVKLGWEGEVARWVPWRSTQVLQTGSDRLQDVDVWILNPELLPRLIEDLVLMAPQAVVLDEAHQYKNPQAQRTELAEDLVEGIGIRLALTGTPIPNRRPDLLQQLRLLGQLEDVIGIYRGLLPHYWRPGDRIRHDWAMRVLERLPRRDLHERLRDTCVLRRTKEDVHDELPPFHRTRRDLTLPDASPYQQREKSFLAWVRAQRRGEEGQWKPEVRFQGRQHLSSLRREAALAKIPAVVEWASGLANSPGSGTALHGQERDGNPKKDRKGERKEERETDRERVVYFSHHKQVAHALAEALPGTHPVLTGDVSPAQRQQVIRDLASYDGVVATMDASGQGVDGMQLHARHVVFIELDWTPTKHEQCEGRLHRIGQRDRVEAWYFTARDTVDQAMMRRLDTKWRDVQGILEGEDVESFIDSFVTEVLDRASRGVKGAALWQG